MNIIETMLLFSGIFLILFALYCLIQYMHVSSVALGTKPIDTVYRICKSNINNYKVQFDAPFFGWCDCKDYGGSIGEMGPDITRVFCSEESAKAFIEKEKQKSKRRYKYKNESWGHCD